MFKGFGKSNQLDEQTRLTMKVQSIVSAITFHDDKRISGSNNTLWICLNKYNSKKVKVSINSLPIRWDCLTPGKPNLVPFVSGDEVGGEVYAVWNRLTSQLYMLWFEDESAMTLAIDLTNGESTGDVGEENCSILERLMTFATLKGLQTQVVKGKEKEFLQFAIDDLGPEAKQLFA
jgi:hypothetical protein